MMDSLLRRLSRLVLRWPRSIVAIAVLLTLVSVQAARRVSLLTDVAQLLPESGEASQDLRTYLSHFGSGDRLLVSISISAGEGDHLELLDEAGARLVERLRATGLFRTVADRLSEEDLLAVLRFGLDHLPALVDPGRVGELAERLSAPGMRESLQSLRRGLLTPAAEEIALLASEDPLGLRAFLPLARSDPAHGFRIDLRHGLFLSPDGRALLVVGEPGAPPFDVAYSRRLMQAVGREIGAVRAELESAGPARDSPPAAAARLRLQVAGGHRLASEDESTMRHDMILTACVSLGGVLLVFWLVFRQLAALGLAALPLAMSTSWALGLAALEPGHLNAITVGFAAILLGLGDDSALHLCNRFAEEHARGAPPAGSLSAALAGTGKAIVAANLTTAVGFGLMLFTGFRALAELALLAVYGIASILLSMLVVLPALLAIATSRAGARSSPERMALRVPGLGLQTLLPRVTRSPAIWLGGAAAVATVAAISLAHLSFDMDLRRLRDPSSEAVREEEEILERFGGASEAVYLLGGAGSADAALAAAAELRPALEEARAAGEILGFDAPPPLLASAQAQARAVEASRRAGAFSGAEARLRHALLAGGFRVQEFEPALSRLRRWESGEGLTFPVAGEEGSPQAWLAARHLRAAGALFWVSIPVYLPPGGRAGEVPAPLRSRAREAGFRVVSLAAALRETQEAVVEDFRTLAVLAPVLVLAVVWWTLGRLSAALVALLPAAFGVLAALALAAALEIPISTLTLVVTPLLFGLGIDYGIYIVHRHLEEGSRPSAGALAAAGRTVVITSTTTFIAFASLGLARFRGLREIGLLTACGIASALAAALLALPAALALMERRRAREYDRQQC